MPRRVLHVRYGGDEPTAWSMLMTGVGIGGTLFLTLAVLIELAARRAPSPPGEPGGGPPEGGGQGLVQEPEGEPSRERS